MNFTNSELVLFAVAAVVLLGMNALFVAAEFSLVKLRFTRFGTGRMKEAKQTPAIARMIEDISSSIKTIRLGITSCTIAIGFLVVPLAVSLIGSLGWEDMAVVRVGIAASFAIAVGVHFLIGELVPRAMALQYPVESLKVALPFIGVFRFAAYPLASVLNLFSAVLLRALRLDPKLDLNLLDVEAQIRSLVSEGEELPAFAESIVINALDLSKRVAHDIMIPRNQLRYFDLEDTLEENLKMAQETGHTRFPLCSGDLDNCEGIIHIKDVFRSGKSQSEINFRQLKRVILRFNMDLPLERVLQRFLKQKKHFALLIDEFGGTVGAVTLEDVLEELVGEIQDEFDRDQVMVRDMGDGSFHIDGLTPLHDLSESIGIDFQASEVSTFGGFITFELGQMPKPREPFRIGELEITVTKLDERRVISAIARVVSAEEASRKEDGSTEAAV